MYASNVVNFNNVCAENRFLQLIQCRNSGSIVRKEHSVGVDFIPPDPLQACRIRPAFSQMDKLQQLFKRQT